jgi:hypothetical protein
MLGDIFWYKRPIETIFALFRSIIDFQRFDLLDVVVALLYSLFGYHLRRFWGENLMLSVMFVSNYGRKLWQSNRCWRFCCKSVT